MENNKHSENILNRAHGSDFQCQSRLVQTTPRFLPVSLPTVDDFLSLGLLLAEAGQGLGVGQLPPVGRVLLQLQQAWLHLLRLRGGAGGARAGALRGKERPVQTGCGEGGG